MTAATSPSAASRKASCILHMKGACSGCPSSTATLQHGIQNLLQAFRARRASKSGRSNSVATQQRGICAAVLRLGHAHRSQSDVHARPRHRHRARGLLGRRARHRAPAAIVARESLPMVRGHAEALMPLIARVMDAAPSSNSPSSTASPSPPAPAASPACASASPRRAASRWRPASRPSACRRCRPSPRRFIAADDTTAGGRRRSMRATTMSICRCSAPAAARW